jgi:hypothetical protein
MPAGEVTSISTPSTACSPGLACPSCGSRERDMCHAGDHGHPMRLRHLTLDEGGLPSDDGRKCCMDPFHGRHRFG